MTESSVLEYQAWVQYNRHIFMLNQSDAVWAFHQIHKNFASLGQLLTQHRDAAGKSRVSFIPFVLLMQRQATTAFWALASHQSYQAWVLLRPCLEASLIVGKWEDDPANASIWEKRKEDPDAYRKAYSGKRLCSTSLARSTDIQLVLKRINDDFMHTNPEYYRRHVEMIPTPEDDTFMKLHYFDPDDADTRAHSLAFLHVLMVMQDSMAGLFDDLFPEAERLDVGVEMFRKQFGPKVASFLSEHPDRRPVLEELGLWLSRASA